MAKDPDWFRREDSVLIMKWVKKNKEMNGSCSETCCQGKSCTLSEQILSNVQPQPFDRHSARDHHCARNANQSISCTSASADASTSLPSCVNFRRPSTPDGIYAPGPSCRRTTTNRWTAWYTGLALCRRPMYTYGSRVLLGVQIPTPDAATRVYRE